MDEGAGKSGDDGDMSLFQVFVVVMFIAIGLYIYTVELRFNIVAKFIEEAAEVVEKF